MNAVSSSMTTVPSPLKRWAKRVGELASWVVLFTMGLAALVLIVVPFVSGSQTYTVLTNSMAPNYAPGTFIVVKPTDFNSLQVGDVVTYQVESGRPDVITHRIVGFTADQQGERLLITQGDNNDAEDPMPVREVQVRGSLYYAVPYVGFVANLVGQANRGLLSTVLAVGLIAVGLVTMTRGVIAKKTMGERGPSSVPPKRSMLTPTHPAEEG